MHWPSSNPLQHHQIISESNTRPHFGVVGPSLAFMKRLSFDDLSPSKRARVEGSAAVSLHDALVATTCWDSVIASADVEGCRLIRSELRRLGNLVSVREAEPGQAAVVGSSASTSAWARASRELVSHGGPPSGQVAVAGPTASSSAWERSRLDLDQSKEGRPGQAAVVGLSASTAWERAINWTTDTEGISKIKDELTRLWGMVCAQESFRAQAEPAVRSVTLGFVCVYCASHSPPEDISGGCTKGDCSAERVCRECMSRCSGCDNERICKGCVHECPTCRKKFCFDCRTRHLWTGCWP